jgi:malonyl-CoA O-methyltransferase
MYELDQIQLRRAYDRVASAYDEADFFAAEIRDRLFERLDFISLQPKTLLDLGAGTGAAARQLQTRFTDTLIIGLDGSEAMLANSDRPGTEVCADSHCIPFADASIDIVISNLMLPACAVPEMVFSEVRRVLRNPGLFLFSTLGPDTLKEIRQAWSPIDDAPHVHTFADMHNVGDALVKAGFREPVMDTEIMTVTYADINKLITDLRAVAGTNFAAQRRRGLTSPRHWARFIDELYATRDSAGRFSVSLEVVTGQAWTGNPDIGVPLTDGEARFPLAQLKY